MKIRILDLETTGLDPEQGAEIIEIAAVDVDVSALQIVSWKSELVKPERPITPETSAVHHIIDDDVADARPWRNVRADFGGAEAYCAHNARFERDFLDPHRQSKRPWVCTYKVAVTLWPHLTSHSNQAVRYQLGLLDIHPEWPRARLAIAHRALPDAIVTAGVLIAALKNHSIEDLIAISSGPVLLPRITFGKHAGVAWGELPLDYLHWMKSKLRDWDEDVAHTLLSELEKRNRKGTEHAA